MASDWTELENDLVIRDYLDMLSRELRDVAYSKAEHRRALMQLIPHRSSGSIEFKHQNISAVLLHQGLPYITGYKPRSNYQASLAEQVLAHLSTAGYMELDFDGFALGSRPAPLPGDAIYARLPQPPPKPPLTRKEGGPASKRVFKRDYLKLEQENSKLGEQGELFILNYERYRLSKAGKENLADKIEWVSKEQGDGLGFDILSRELDASDRYIEVKTTKMGELTPFYFSRNELEVSREKRSRYHLYRVYHFAQKPAFFQKQGSFDDICSYSPTQFMGRI